MIPHEKEAGEVRDKWMYMIKPCFVVVYYYFFLFGFIFLVVYRYFRLL